MKRILHVVTFMGRGGLEVWLMEIMRRTDRTKYHYDILVQSDVEGLFDEEIRTLGFNVIQCPSRGKPLKLLYLFSKVLFKNKKYDVVHSHIHHPSAFILAIAKLFRVKMTVTHSHNICYADRSDLSIIRKLYLSVSEFLLKYVSDYGFGVSDGASEELFGKDFRNKTNRSTLYCGVPVVKTRPIDDINAFKKGLGIDPDKIIIGNVGRFNYQKNHDLIFDVFQNVLKTRKDVVLMLVGEGELKESFQNKVKNLKLDDNIKFLGDRSDVPDLLQIMDMFFFPSRFEGLGLALVEAQVAGLPCLLSDTIPKDAHIVKDLIRVVSLDDSIEYWTTEFNDLLQNNIKNPQLGYDTVLASPHNVENCKVVLEALYDKS